MNQLHLKKNSYAGRLIVFEGTDGAGKTTLVTLTKRYCEETGSEAIAIKQPTDLSRKTKLFQKMMYCADHREIDYRAVQLLTMSDRIQQNHEVIEPALKDGKTVICDRYIYTSLANMLARGYDQETWFFEAGKHLIQPDHIFLVYVSPDKAIERIKQRIEEKDRYLDTELLARVSAQFLKMSYQERFTVLDGTQPPEVTFEEIRKELESEQK